MLFHLGFGLWRAPGVGFSNWDGTRNVLAARPGRVVLASTAAVYGARPTNPLPLTEDYWPRPNPECPYAVQKLRVERLCSGSCPTLILRIGAVLGPHADPRVASSVRGYRLAVPAPMGKNAALQFLDEDDGAMALLLAGKSSTVGVLNIAPSDWLSPREVASVAGSRVVPLPRRVFLAASEVSYRLGTTPFGRDRAILMDGPLALDPARADSVLGWKAAKTSASVLATALR